MYARTFQSSNQNTRSQGRIMYFQHVLTNQWNEVCKDMLRHPTVPANIENTYEKIRIIRYPFLAWMKQSFTDAPAWAPTTFAPDRLFYDIYAHISAPEHLVAPEQMAQCPLMIQTCTTEASIHETWRNKDLGPTLKTKSLFTVTRHDALTSLHACKKCIEIFVNIQQLFRNKS